jgi:hypothetical protein
LRIFAIAGSWREKNRAGDGRYVFFGLSSDIEVAHYLTELIDNAVRSELGRYKIRRSIAVSGTRIATWQIPPSH